VHRTVSGAPTARNLQRSASPNKERDPHRTMSGGAPDCPVRQATEGKNCLLEMLSTAPSCLGAIKGTPRRMEEHTKQFSKHSYRRFETGGSLSRRVNVVACPSPDGSTRGRARRGEVRWSETSVREVEIPRPSCSSRTQVGCACSRGLQASTREREASGPKRAPVPSSSPRGQPSLRGPWSFLL
jgi:hypothetical protein